MMTRQEANFKILYGIEQYVINNPDLRFDQILWAMKIVDGHDYFYRESVDLLAELEHEHII